MSKPAIEPSELNDVFDSLHEEMELYDVPRIVLYIIGGAAMNLGKHVHRTTVDVDLLGITYESDPDKVRSLHSNFPDEFRRCIDRVTEEFNLLENWLNFGPSGLIDALPVGFLGRAKQIIVGQRLAIRVAARIDLIYLKTHAVANTFGTPLSEVHHRDLEVLDPTPAELREAVQWSRDIYQSTSDAWNWDNRHLHVAYREIVMEISGQSLADDFFDPGGDHHGS